MAADTELTFKTTGMHCRSCSTLVDMTVGDLEGVEKVQTDHVSGDTEVAFDAGVVSLDEIVAAIRSVGYDVELPE